MLLGGLIMDYRAVNAKIKAMKSRLLTPSDYHELAKSKSVPEIFTKLKNFHTYKKIVVNLNENNLHRGNIENNLTLPLMDDFKHIYNFVPDFKLKKYLSAFFMRNEINILKSILSMIYDKKDIKYALYELNFLLGNKLNVNTKKLAASSSIDEFINNLKGTKFYNLLYETYNQFHSLFKLEIELDLYYYSYLQKLQRKYVHGEDKKILDRIQGIKNDLTNINLIYRIKKYYNFDSASIFSYLIPNKCKLNSTEISHMIKSNTIDELKKVLYKTYYGKLFAANENLKIERITYICLSNEYYKFYLRGSNNISGIMYLLYLKQLELSNITSIIEGVRYLLPEKEILKYIYIKEA